jgi:magnesium transporter
MTQLPFFIHDLHLEDIHNPEHPSTFMLEENYSLLILRLAFFRGDTLEVASFPFVIHDENSYFYERETKTFKDLGSGFHGLYKAIDHAIDGAIQMLLLYHEKIDQCEETLYAPSKKDFLKEWHVQKKEMIRIHRLKIKAVSTLFEFLELYKKEKEFLHNEFDDVIEHLERCERSAQSALLKLDQIYNFYSVQTSEKINKSIFYLTIISAIFLPLNLVVGFFGMNTGGLPFEKHPHGTFAVMGGMFVLMIFLILVVLLYFKKKR